MDVGFLDPISKVMNQIKNVPKNQEYKHVFLLQKSNIYRAQNRKAM